MSQELRELCDRMASKFKYKAQPGSVDVQSHEDGSKVTTVRNPDGTFKTLYHKPDGTVVDLGEIYRNYLASQKQGPSPSGS